MSRTYGSITPRPCATGCAILRPADEEAIALTDEVTYRIWRLYMTGCAYNFERGGLGVCQTLLHKPTGGHSGLPPTRVDWYTGSAL